MLLFRNIHTTKAIKTINVHKEEQQVLNCVIQLKTVMLPESLPTTSRYSSGSGWYIMGCDVGAIGIVGTMGTVF